MAQYFPGERVLLRSEKTGTITQVLLDNPLATNARYQVALDPFGQPLIGINGLDIMGPLPPLADRFFARQRTIARNVLGPGASKVETFKNLLHSEHNTIGMRPGINVSLAIEVSKKPSRSDASIVFMGMKTIAGETVAAIFQYGITALKYLDDAKSATAGVHTITTVKQDPSQAATMRLRFSQGLPVLAHNNTIGLDEFKLLGIVNGHKGGDTQNSGFHSTSGKPEYASEYADASGQVIGKTYYNFGVAIEITDQCYPVVIQEAIENWNKRRPQSFINMAFAKKEESWKRDYESEIVLGGATPPSDFVYFGAWAVTRTGAGPMPALGSELKNFNLKKTSSIK